MRSSIVACLASISLLAINAATLAAEEGEKPTPPKVALANPLAVEPGQTTKVVLRGWGLDQANEVKCTGGVQTKIVGKGGAPVPGGQDAKRIGDQQIEVELTVPAEFAARELSLNIAAPAGEASYVLLAGGDQPRTAEQEANDGFRQAQVIELPRIIDGQIHGDRNVDVFAFAVADGQSVVFEIIADRLGSALDGVLTLYDDAGNVLAINDDANQRDPRIEHKFAKAGRYFLVVQDAHDLGGPAHPYRLIAK